MASLDAKSIVRIDRQRFADMLNILPPVSWVGIGNQAESFRLSECVDGDIRSSHDSIVERCRAFQPFDASTSSAAVTDRAHL